jgi:hypothetical protein
VENKIENLVENSPCEIKILKEFLRFSMRKSFSQGG